MIKRLSKEQALPQVKQFCVYRERCHSEVKEKLYSLGLYKNDVEQLMAQLIEENYLNEERFAKQYAGGKFRMNHWGKVKITYELKQKQVSAYNIRRALQAITDADYFATLQKLAEAKLISSPFVRVKLITKGEVTKKVKVSLQGASSSAIKAVEKAGGSFTQVEQIKRSAKLKEATKRASAVLDRNPLLFGRVEIAWGDEYAFRNLRRKSEKSVETARGHYLRAYSRLRDVEALGLARIANKRLVRLRKQMSLSRKPFMPRPGADLSRN